MSGIYVYAVIPTESELVFEADGVDGEGAVYTVMHDGLAAVTSPSPLGDYRGLQRNEVIPYLVAHQRVVEAVMEEYALLPIRFGTVLPDATWILRLLQQGRPFFHRALEMLGHRVQMEVVVLWELARVFGEIAQEEPIVQAKQQMASRPEDMQTLQIVVGQMVKASLERRRAALKSRIVPSLQEITSELVQNGSMDDSMVANLALLLDATGCERLDRQLDVLDAEFGGQLTFRRVGPLPPYSFATIEARRPAWAEIDAARSRLGLGLRVSAGEIKRAYHQHAARLHPDHNREDPDAPGQMAALSQAYELLASYAQSWAFGQPLSGQATPRSFAPEEVERTLLLSIQGQRMPSNGQA